MAEKVFLTCERCGSHEVSFLKTLGLDKLFQCDSCETKLIITHSGDVKFLDYIECESCGQINGPETKICQNCGIQIRNECPKCLRYNDLAATYCPYCGINIQNYIDEQEQLYNITSNPVQDRTRRIVITGVLSAISVFLGITRLGFIPWITGASLTIMPVPVIIGAVLEGPVVGLAIGLIFGVFSLLQSAVAPTGPVDVWFTNPLLSILPRLFIGPVSWLIYRLLERWKIPALIMSGAIGSLTNTVLVLVMIGVLGYLPWAALPAIILGNGMPEAVASAVLVVGAVKVWQQIETLSEKEGSKL